MEPEIYGQLEDAATWQDKPVAKVVKLFKYTCRRCGWTGYRGEELEQYVCSNCGSTNEPETSIVWKTLAPSPEIMAEIDKRHKAAKNPEDSTPATFLSDLVRSTMLRGVFTADMPKVKGMNSPDTFF